MTHQVMAIYDKKAKMYGAQLLLVASVAVGVRSFTAVVNDEKESPYHKYPEDFALFRMGEFDDVSGVLVATQPVPELVINAVNVLRAPGDARQLSLEA